MDYVLDILEACDLYPLCGIETLIDKCLVMVDQYKRLTMHDLVQKMGREIVRQESPQNPRERSRVWCYKDALDVLTENTVLVVLIIFLHFLHREDVITLISFLFPLFKVEENLILSFYFS